MVFLCFLFFVILLDPSGFPRAVPIDRVAVLLLQDPILDWCSLDNIGGLPTVHVNLAILIEYF